MGCLAGYVFCGGTLLGNKSYRITPGWMWSGRKCVTRAGCDVTDTGSARGAECRNRKTCGISSCRTTCAKAAGEY